MTTSNQVEFIPLKNLSLDYDNPRLPSQIRKDKDLEEIINWMLLDASIVELMLAIGQSGFFIGESLLVVKEGRKYVVIEGNRRLTASMLLSKPSLATVHTKKIEKVLEETTQRPKELPCIVFDDRKEITKYLGYRHVTGVKAWGVLAKARYLMQMLEQTQSTNFEKQCRELAKSIGSRSDYVRKLLIAYKLYEEIEDESFYRIPALNETTLHFNYLSDSISKQNIREFLNLDDDCDLGLDGLDHKNLETLTKWFFEKNSNNRARVLGTSSDLSMLDEILGNSKALESFSDGSESLQETYDRFKASADSFHGEIKSALASLKRAKTYEHMVEQHHDSDIPYLEEIFRLSRSIKASINSKEADDEQF